MGDPRDVVAAVVHPDPYPYYARLVAGAPIHRDERLGLWIAARAGVVAEVLTSPACRVRPLSEPVPAAIAGSPVGAIYGAMMRFNDGARHASLKDAISARLGALHAADVSALSRDVAAALAAELRLQDSREALMPYVLRLAPSVVASLLGAPAERLAEVARWTAAFVAATAPGASPDIIRDGAAAAGHLIDEAREWARRDGLLAAFARHFPASEHDRVVANGLGLLWQAYDATAALVGNTLVALGRAPGLRTAYDLTAIVAEVARHDAPVQNTRRFLADDAVLGGQPMTRGDAVLLVLAAANRDAAANPDPARMDPQRAAPRVFTFGHGAHACPGAMLATSIAAAGVETLLASGIDPASLAGDVIYRPSPNIRMPMFAETG